VSAGYRGEVGTAFEVLGEGLAPFVDERMSAAFPHEDWILTAAGKLGKRRDVLVSLSDPHFQLEVINRWWAPVFAGALGEARRSTITELRTARNHWAHPDPDHPVDVDEALRVHQAAEDVLRAIDAPEADRVRDLADAVRWRDLGEQAGDRGVSEAELLLHELTRLQKQRDELFAQLEHARHEARSASGRQRAVARQLAELQSQYAAVSGLRDDYESLRRQLERGGDGPADGPTTHREQLAVTSAAVDELRHEAAVLRDELGRTRREVRHLDPVHTDAGRRWVWLMIGLVLTLAITVVLVAFSVPGD
jgi:hypothetical protein